MARRIHVRTEPRTRSELEAVYGRVWDTAELAVEFIVTSVIAPDIVVVRGKNTGEVGTLLYQNDPRLYFNFRPAPPTDG